MNELNAAPDEIVLVLDDYHVIDAPEVHDGMAYLLDHLPDSVHLVSPPAPIHLFRWRGCALGASSSKSARRPEVHSRRGDGVFQ